MTNREVLYDKTAGAGSDNVTKYAAEYFPDLQCQPWCGMFVWYCFIKAYGMSEAKRLMCGDLSAYTPTMAQYFKNKKQWYLKPKRGDVIFFHNSERICHTGIVVDVTSTTVVTIEGNTSAGSTIIANGGAVCKKSYSLSNGRISGYGRPAYKGTVSVDSGSPAASQAKSSSKTLNEKKQKDGIVTAKALNVRKWAGTEYEQCSFSPLAHGQKVGICDTVYAANGDKWYYILFGDKHGFVSAKYIV